MKPFYFVTGCGPHNKTIFQVGECVILDHIVTCYAEAAEVIAYHYKEDEQPEYLKKLELLKAGGESWDKYPWDKYSWYVAIYCPNKIDPALYNWETDSECVAYYCPEKLALRPRPKNKYRKR